MVLGTQSQPIDTKTIKARSRATTPAHITTRARWLDAPPIRVRSGSTLLSSPRQATPDRQLALSKNLASGHGPARFRMRVGPQFDHLGGPLHVRAVCEVPCETVAQGPGEGLPHGAVEVGAVKRGVEHGGRDAVRVEVTHRPPPDARHGGPRSGVVGGDDVGHAPLDGGAGFHAAVDGVRPAADPRELQPPRPPVAQRDEALEEALHLPAVLLREPGPLRRPAGLPVAEVDQGVRAAGEELIVGQRPVRGVREPREAEARHLRGGCQRAGGSSRRDLAVSFCSLPCEHRCGRPNRVFSRWLRWNRAGGNPPADRSGWKRPK
mmetsp:Transcript_55423/g.116004  ORF Transcript_55423/g.116004 Transcript_55423/m.116004 type:complete len:321 (+) Transcript_55423:433-1395(+)